MRIKETAWALFAALALAGTLSAPAADIVYDNSTNFTLVDYETTDEYGDEVYLAGTSRAITEIQIEYYADFVAQGDEVARVRFYENTGPFWEGNSDYPTPASPPLYEQTFPIQQGYQVEILTVPNVVVPDHFTWTIQFLGISQTATNDRAGLLFYDTPTVGSSPADFWEFVPPDGWGAVAVQGVTNNFGCRILAAPASARISLAISRVGNNVLISWPSGDPSFALEYKADLNAATWTAVTQTPTLTGSRYEVTLPIGAANRIFHLRSP
jgi:hypothetical protein